MKHLGPDGSSRKMHVYVVCVRLPASYVLLVVDQSSRCVFGRLALFSVTKPGGSPRLQSCFSPVLFLLEEAWLAFQESGCVWPGGFTRALSLDSSKEVCVWHVFEGPIPLWREEPS